MDEMLESRLKRLRMRSWRRGTKEMDLILGGFADAELAKLPPDALDAHEAMMAEHDQDLYAWITGAAAAPPEHDAALRRVLSYLSARSF